MAFRSAGGTRESIVHGHSGLLANDDEQFVEHLRSVLVDPGLRTALSQGAHEVSGRFSWEQARASFAHVLRRVHAGERVVAEDEENDGEDEIRRGERAPQTPGPAATGRSRS